PDSAVSATVPRARHGVPLQTPSKTVGADPRDRPADVGAHMDAPLQARMILQVHDELLFEVRESDVEALRALVKSAMESVQPFDGPLAVPLVADFKSGPNWRDMK
ncbi:MAG TPA: DNA polymerase, partial [Candidatus Nitrosotenuis sp.]|nr:DNA polymerase [Candidatus Nitrosotenuis sp.]